jgi:hypothetical protein
LAAGGVEAGGVASAGIGVGKALGAGAGAGELLPWSVLAAEVDVGGAGGVGWSSRPLTSAGRASISTVSLGPYVGPGSDAALEPGEGRGAEVPLAAGAAPSASVGDGVGEAGEVGDEVPAPLASVPAALAGESAPVGASPSSTGGRGWGVPSLVMVVLSVSEAGADEVSCA